jgi:hypothetical protein
MKSAVPINWAKPLLNSRQVTSLSDLAKQNTVEMPVLKSTISVPAHGVRSYQIVVDRNRMANPELDGSFSSQGRRPGGDIRVMVVGQSGMFYNSGRRRNADVHLPLTAGTYQLVLDNKASPRFSRSVRSDFRLRYVQ